jgi:curved DNA-binding protein CbpA
MPTVGVSKPTYYEILGVSRFADGETIRRAYRELSKRYHPDTTTLPLAVAQEKFHQINTAYTVLISPQQRAIYDQQLWQSTLPPVPTKQRKPQPVFCLSRSDRPPPFARRIVCPIAFGRNLCGLFGTGGGAGIGSVRQSPCLNDKALPEQETKAHKALITPKAYLRHASYQHNGPTASGVQLYLKNFDILPCLKAGDSCSWFCERTYFIRLPL